MKKIKIVDFDPAELLTNNERITNYINDALETGDAEYIKSALATVIRATNVTKFASNINMSRPGIYRALKPKSHTEFASVLKMFSGLGMKLRAIV